MRDVNKVIVTGRLGKDPDLRITPNGKSVATFSVASSRNVKEGDGYKEQTEWFRVTAWDKLAETCSSYLKKGSHVYIEGRLQTREWTDDQNQKRTTTEVILQEMTMLGSKADSESRQPAGVAAGGGYEGGEDETDIPF